MPYFSLVYHVMGGHLTTVLLFKAFKILVYSLLFGLNLLIITHAFRDILCKHDLKSFQEVHE